jgi:hypothetical protein
MPSSKAHAHKDHNPGMQTVETHEGPRTVQRAQLVNLGLVWYTDDENQKHVQLAVIGEKTVHLLEGKTTGFSNITTRQGPANDWLRDAIFEALQTKEV